MATIPFSQLLQVAPPGVIEGNPTSAPPSGSWLATMLTIASALGLPTTAWQSGQPLRTMLELAAVVQSNQDGTISQAIQGGFLDYASTGTYTTYDLQGNATSLPVSPDPSTVTPTPASWVTWLDALAYSEFGVTRIAASYAQVTIAISNSTASTYPQAAGAMHVANLGTGATYTNRDAISITPTTNIGGGIQSTASVGGLIGVTTKSAHGILTGAVVTIAGTSTSADGTWTIAVTGATTFTLNSSAFSSAATAGTISAAAVSAVFIADAIGPAGSSVAGGISQLVTPLAGVTVTNPSSCVGANWESNTALAARCRLKFASLSPNGADAAYEYWALTSSQLLPSPVVLEGGPITRVLVLSSGTTGYVTVVVANAAGAVSGCVEMLVTGCTSSGGLVEITTQSAHGLATGNYATISGVGGVPGANVTSTVTVLDATHFTIDGSTFTGAYTSGGVVEGGDLGELDALLQANVVPQAVTELTVSATAQAVNVVADIYLPATAIAAGTAAVNAALVAYFATIAIGGDTDPGGAYTNVVPFDAVVGEVYGAIKPLGGTQVAVALNGGTANVSVGTQSVPTAGTLTVRAHAV